MEVNTLIIGNPRSRTTMVLSSMIGKQIYEPFHPSLTTRKYAEMEYGEYYPTWDGKGKHKWLRQVKGCAIKTVSTHHREHNIAHMIKWADRLIVLTRPLEESIISHELQRSSAKRSYREWHKGNPATVPLHSVRVPDNIISKFLRSQEVLERFIVPKAIVLEYKDIPDGRMLQHRLPFKIQQPTTTPSPFNPMDYIHPESLAKIRSLV